MPVLCARQLSKRYSGLHVVHDVNLTVRPGQVVGYLGPNGSGKTTTARMLSGLLEPSNGIVEYDGHDIRNDLLAFRKRLGYIPEEPYLYPFLSGREYLELVGRLREMPESLLNSKIDGFLRLFNLSGAADQSIASYSKGMRQKIVISAALLHDPDVVIFDEPETGLDVSTTMMLRHLVRMLASRGKAILYSSHILEVVEKLCDHIIVLQKGKVVADDSIANLRTLLSSTSLEGVFSQLVIREDPEQLARDLADLSALRGVAMRVATQITAWLQLTRLFLKQFLENDLVSPDSDRAQLLAIVGAGVISMTLFLSMFLSAGYAMSVLTPGEAAVRTLNDKFFYVSLAMLITALVAAAQWDALSLDQRDAAILDPLPVRPAIVRWAKLTAVAMLGAAVALAVNAFPAMIFPWMVSFSLRQMTAGDVFWLMAIHFMITVTAAVFGYLAVMTLRESLNAILGPKLFARISPSFQASTIVVLGSLLLLLPPASTRVAERQFSGRWVQSPPMAFVAAYEVASHSFIVDLPRRKVTARMTRRDVANTKVYEGLRPLFLPMGKRVELLFGALFAILITATAVSAVRAPVGGTLIATSGSRRSRISERIVNTLIVRHPAARAGFHFAVATLFRSKTHRLTLACAAAVGLAMALVVLSRLELQPGSLSASVLVIQPLLYGSLLVGFRHLLRVPAELRANWGVQLAWRDHPKLFRAGVYRAGILTLALPVVLGVVPVVAFVADITTAMAHAAIGLGGAIVFLEALTVGYDKAPFTCNYVPGSGKGVLPIFVLAFLLGANLFARLELSMLLGTSTVAGVVLLVVLFGGLRVASIRRRDPQMDFNEGPETFSQLGLHN